MPPVLSVLSSGSAVRSRLWLQVCSQPCSQFQWLYLTKCELEDLFLKMVSGPSILNASFVFLQLFVLFLIFWEDILGHSLLPNSVIVIPTKSLSPFLSESHWLVSIFYRSNLIPPQQRYRWWPPTLKQGNVWDFQPSCETVETTAPLPLARWVAETALAQEVRTQPPSLPTFQSIPMQPVLLKSVVCLIFVVVWFMSEIVTSTVNWRILNAPICSCRSWFPLFFNAISLPVWPTTAKWLRFNMDFHSESQLNRQVLY